MVNRLSVELTEGYLESFQTSMMGLLVKIVINGI